MADTAFQTQYRQEFIAGFEQRHSLLRETVTTEAVIKGNNAVFLVADSGDAEANARGTNGLIPARADNLTQNTAVLQEWHDLVRKTAARVGVDAEIPQEAVLCFGDYVGPGYSLPTPSMNVIKRSIWPNFTCVKRASPAA